ncbi:MAG: redoxin domain-containing protein [Candidatus Coatesbacteria bacterium]|nr:redoxin domain-containing protein [Candidatus Coatesbacteria bacterium]
MRKTLIIALLLLSAVASLALTDELVAEIITEFYTVAYTGLTEEEIYEAYGTSDAELSEYLDNLSDERVEAIFLDVEERYNAFMDTRMADFYGVPPALFTAEAFSGGELELEELLDDDKVIFINVFATWCPPCRAEIPAFLELMDEMEEDFLVVGVSVDDFASLEDLAPFIEEQEIDYPVVLYTQLEEDAMVYYQADAVPTTWVVDPDGNVQQIIVGSREKEEFRALIEELL